MAYPSVKIQKLQKKLFYKWHTPALHLVYTSLQTSEMNPCLWEGN